MGAFGRRLLWSVPFAVTFTDVVASVIRVDGASMQPTLNPRAPRAAAAAPGARDWVLVEKWSIKLMHTPQRGDVVVMWAPDAPHQQIVKRLLALEGDTLDVPGEGPATIPEASGRCWVEGDNAAESLDSRSAYGPVHMGLLEGRVAFIVWPPARARRVDPARPPGRLLHAAGDGERGAA
ncbi:MAG: mitochondrial inner membrane signal peptidase [Monoraphidium minutum]|nr:MAG: mitochondrial inner membrane signal peptidase [Monoraphidium minutum]